MGRVERLAQGFILVLVLATLPHWLFVQGKRYGAAEQAACSSHCRQVGEETPGQGGEGALDAQADACTCARGEPTYIPPYDRAGR